jgi:hypothetical protein
MGDKAMSADKSETGQHVVSLVRIPEHLVLENWTKLIDREEALRRDLAAAHEKIARMREAIAPYHNRLKSNFAEGCYMYEMEKIDLDAMNAVIKE